MKVFLKIKLETNPKYPWPNCVYWHVVGRLEEKLTPTTKRKFRILRSITFVVDDVTRQNHNLSKVEGVFFNVCVNGSYKPMRNGGSTSDGRANTKISRSKTRRQKVVVDEFTNTLEKEDWVQECDVQVWRRRRDPFLQRDFWRVLLGKTFTFHYAYFIISSSESLFFIYCIDDFFFEEKNWQLHWKCHL